MTIKKFTGKTQEEAALKAKQELGEQCVIMNIKSVKPSGIFRLFRSTVFEVTAAIEEKESFPLPNRNLEKTDFSNQMERINFIADEKIDFKEEILTHSKPNVVFQPDRQRSTHMLEEKNVGLEEKIENLQSLLENKLSEKNNQKNFFQEEPFVKENLTYVKAIYKTLLENEVHEHYANQLLDEVDKVMRSATSLDYILSTMYQKMILKLGQPRTISLGMRRPKVLFFVGPTGVGKTTTIAKLASKLKMEQHKKIALLTADTYRIAAAEQLRTYANILDTPLSIIYSVQELRSSIMKVIDSDFILVDTAGFSHKNEEQRMDMKQLVESVDSDYEKEVFLVVSATTKYKDLVQIADSYKEIADYRLIFTKLDETSAYGNIYNLKQYTGAELSYVTVGQNVPDDISIFDTQKIVRNLLGGN